MKECKYKPGDLVKFGPIESMIFNKEDVLLLVSLTNNKLIWNVVFLKLSKPNSILYLNKIDFLHNSYLKKCVLVAK